MGCPLFWQNRDEGFNPIKCNAPLRKMRDCYFLAKQFICGDYLQHMIIEVISAVLIQKIVGIFISFQIVLQRPDGPVEIDMLVADTGHTQVDKGTEASVVTDNIGQTGVGVMFHASCLDWILN